MAVFPPSIFIIYLFAGNFWAHISWGCFVPLGDAWREREGSAEIHWLHQGTAGQLEGDLPGGRGGEREEHQELWPTCLPAPPLSQRRNMCQVRGHLWRGRSCEMRPNWQRMRMCLELHHSHSYVKKKPNNVQILADMADIILPQSHGSALALRVWGWFLKMCGKLLLLTVKILNLFHHP